MDNRISGTTSPERFAPHLSEFYPIVNNTRTASIGGLPKMDSGELGSGSSGYKRRMTPASVRSGMSSISDLRTLVTKRDMKDTVDAMSELRSSSRGYACSLREVSNHAGCMAQALEKLARLKGCSDGTAEKFLSASGLFYLVANHENIMARCLDSALDEELLEEIDEFQVGFRTMENEFKKECKEQSMKLKLQEKHNTKLAKRKVRNLVQYKESLLNLQLQLDHLETLRHDFYQNSYNLVESTCDKVLDKMATVSRARVEISESVARKGWSGGGLDELLIDAEDPFGKDEETICSDEDMSPEAPNRALSSDDRDSKGNTVQEPSTPKKAGSTSKTLKSPLLSSLRTHASSLNEEQEDRDREDDEAAFDNSFSLPLAGSGRSRNEASEDNERTILAGLTTLALEPTETRSDPDRENGQDHPDLSP
ncbi:hypothetical protein HG536_0H01890 [Torulaspora globosa]|uniref:IMD domain-containing protein n=1 Tax=Torulaspora globosa TaxID=48254 RepID=A0A7G3ZMS8_9SACH|nr:uncharacterized protein HG536_0H01890 [Torulaspora globosa]QLL34814.1 hypothetical protein HG536_0H01890 [Torulaspora globosa]